MYAPIYFYLRAELIIRALDRLLAAAHDHFILDDVLGRPM